MERSIKATPFFFPAASWFIVWEREFLLEMPDKTSTTKDESEKTIAEDLVVTKYKMAGDIVNRKLYDIL